MEERLQKLIAEAGIASRRKAEELITAGEVAVNGTVVTELGTKADPERDHIRVRGRLINDKIVGRELIYVLLNKPRGYLSSTADPENRPLAIDLLPPNIRGKVHTVGRLDFNTEGLLILTNDGKLTDAVARAGRVPKVYHAKLKGHPSDEQIDRLRRGIPLDGRRTAPADIRLLDATGADNAWYSIVLVEGKNQQIRKMFDATGHSVVKLRRVQIGPITDVGLRTGGWRFLTEGEVARLMRPNPRQRKSAKAAEAPAASAPESAGGEAGDAATAPKPKRPIVPDVRVEGTGKPGGPTRRLDGVPKSRKGRAGGPRSAAKSGSAPKRAGGPKSGAGPKRTGGRGPGGGTAPRGPRRGRS